jgi:hypothetical protein
LQLPTVPPAATGLQSELTLERPSQPGTTRTAEDPQQRQSGAGLIVSTAYHAHRRHVEKITYHTASY